MEPSKFLEDYRPGYPRYAALISSNGPYFLCRRFNKLRARLLLLKQDRLSMLEQRLDRVDEEEASALFLGKSRVDKNVERRSLQLEIESCLADYDQFVERTYRLLSYPPAHQRDVESLQNWLSGTGCLAREETAYLSHSEELMSLAPEDDSALLGIESWVEDKLIRFYRGFRDSRFHNVSSDPNVYIYSGPMIRRIARAWLFLIISILLLMPVVVCNIISTTSVRIVIVLVFTVSYLLILSGLMKSRTKDLVIAGATYATVLIVFVPGSGSNH
ncbi:hypothetical protein CP533_2193 [Ophiocordyceps camponoti-saundersi (nom. inval.)]|nr:hypothetical protein CP533_2193 [Ophiocordyceps camponoti-saundersi (nom. inval.)]